MTDPRIEPLRRALENLRDGNFNADLERGAEAVLSRLDTADEDAGYTRVRHPHTATYRPSCPPCMSRYNAGRRSA